MQVFVETTAGLERRMTVAVPSEQVETEVSARLRSMARTTRIDGFRPGKVPFDLVKKRYAQQVRLEVAGDLMQRGFYTAIGQEKLRPAGYPQITPINMEPGKDLEFAAVFEVYPEISLTSIDSIVLDMKVATIADTDVDTMVEKVRKQRVEWVVIDRPAATGDRVIIDFVGTIEGEAFKGNEGTQVPVEIGASRMIKGFEEKLVGTKSGDELSIDLEFPADYHFAEVAGKPVRFDIKVSTVESSQLPAIDEAFVQSLGIEAGTEDALRHELRDNMQRELDNSIRANLKRQVSDKLFEMNSIEFPKALIEQEVKHLKEQYGRYTDESFEAKLHDQAQRRVALGLIFAEIVKNNNLSVPPERLRQEVEKAAASYEQSDEVVAWFYSNKERLAEIEANVLEDVIVDWVMGQAKVNEVVSTFDDVMGVR